MITKEQAGIAVSRMAVIKYFPSEDMARAELARMLIRMVDTGEQLEWLVRSVVENCEEYPGPKEIRGIFCTRYKPLDGVEVWSAIPGFTAADSEQAHAIKAAELKGFLEDGERSGKGLKRIQ